MSARTTRLYDRRGHEISLDEGFWSTPASYAQLAKVLGHKQNMMAELTHEQALDSWHSLAGPSSPAEGCVCAGVIDRHAAIVPDRSLSAAALQLDSSSELIALCHHRSLE